MKASTVSPAAGLMQDRNGAYCDSATLPGVNALTLPVYVYALCDSTGVRYVGQTYDRPSRLADHVARGAPRVQSWMRQLALRGESPEMITLEVIKAGRDALKAERFWIARYSHLDLLNVRTERPTRYKRTRKPCKLGQRIAALRAQLGLSQRKLCAVAGLSASHVRLIEAGYKTRISAATASRLATALGVSLETLITDNS